MRKALSAIGMVIIIGLLSGCSGLIDPIEPSNTSPQQSIVKSNEITVFDLPAMQEQSLNKFSDWVLVTPGKGGVAEFSTNSQSNNGKKIHILLTLTFPPGAVTAPTYVRISHSGKKLVFDFLPNGAVFQKPAILDAYICGLDLSDLTPNSTVALYYMDNNVNEPVQAESVTWNVANGSITYKGGQIPHFSIYGFGFTK